MNDMKIERTGGKRKNLSLINYLIIMIIIFARGEVIVGAISD